MMVLASLQSGINTYSSFWTFFAGIKGIQKINLVQGMLIYAGGIPLSSTKRPPKDFRTEKGKNCT